ncbi:MAG: dihydroxyacetone kinase family protein [Salipiger marinus]|uniref:dihydroxyacetone kinase family protein n=1 Tax=Salipiger marinus TaxID=555512 RepID=UPI0040585714
MKKFINTPKLAVREALEGLAASNDAVCLLSSANVLLRSDIPSDPKDRPIAILSGGGAGHEPAHAGYVGKGMLSAAVAGDVFTSPSVDAVLAGIRACAGPAGAVLVVKNYTGDRLNFGLAAELARAEGIPTEVVLVADDVALLEMSKDNARGIAGTVLVHKIAGAAVEEGMGFADVVATARAAAADLASMGVALDGCTLPGAERSGFDLGEDEIEYGMGIHGEKGQRRAPMAEADEIVDAVIGTVIAHLDAGSNRVGLLVNGLGSTTPLELAIVARRAVMGLKAAGFVPELVWTGDFMTALDMPGMSLTALPLDDRRAALLGAPTAVRVWPVEASAPKEPIIVEDGGAEAAEVLGGTARPELKRAALAAATALRQAEPDLTRLDAETGDGDLGQSMLRAAEALEALPDGAFADPATLLAQAGMALRRVIGGSSGPFYAAALLRASQKLQGVSSPGPADWLGALRAACEAISDMGGAAPGDRTMLDALAAAHEAGNAPAAGETVAAAAARGAREGAARTAEMQAKFGRASYLGDRAMGHQDAGAAAVAVWMQALAS